MGPPKAAVRIAAAVIALCAVAAGVLPAYGVQTTTFGLTAAGGRTKIVHEAQAAPIHDGIVVYNRTGKPITVALDVVGVTRKSDGSYSLGASGTGLAARVRLDTRSLRLPGKARQNVGVTIDAPEDLKAPVYAAVTGVANPGQSTGVAVTERLAVLVGVTPRTDVSATSHTAGATHKRTVAVVVASVLLLALLAILIAAVTLRRRRRPTGEEAT